MCVYITHIHTRKGGEALYFLTTSKRKEKKRINNTFLIPGNSFPSL
jgi:hypothetical protein